MFFPFFLSRFFFVCSFDNRGVQANLCALQFFSHVYIFFYNRGSLHAPWIILDPLFFFIFSFFSIIILFITWMSGLVYVHHNYYFINSQRRLQFQTVMNSDLNFGFRCSLLFEKVNWTVVLVGDDRSVWEWVWKLLLNKFENFLFLFLF